MKQCLLAKREEWECNLLGVFLPSSHLRPGPSRSAPSPESSCWEPRHFSRGRWGVSSPGWVFHFPCWPCSPVSGAAMGKLRSGLLSPLDSCRLAAGTQVCGPHLKAMLRWVKGWHLTPGGDRPPTMRLCWES